MRNYEAATEVLRHYTGDRSNPIEAIVTRMFTAQFVADYGCAPCNGTGMALADKLPAGLPEGVYTLVPIPCPSGHVKLVNPHDDTTVYADPAKCDWRCRWDYPWSQQNGCESAVFCSADGYSNDAEWDDIDWDTRRPHDKCGWVPIHPLTEASGR